MQLLRLIDRKLFCWLFLAAMPGFAFGQAGPRLAWEKLYGDDGLETELGGLAVHPNGTLTVAALAQRPGVGVGAARVVLWTLGTEGEVRATKGLGDPAPMAEIRDLARVGGDLWLLGLTASERAVLVELQGSRVESLQGLGGPVAPWKIVGAPDGTLVLLGNRSLDFLIARVDKSGKLLGQDQDDRGAMDSLFDGEPAPGGGFVAVGDSGTYDMLSRGPSQVWVRRYSPDGKVVAERTFLGRRGRLAGNGKGSYLLVYDQAATDAQQIRAELLDEGLKTLWQREILNVPRGYATFDALHDAPGWIVFGAQEDKPFLTGLDTAGKPAWTFWDPALQPADEYQAVVLKDQIFVASSTFVEGGDGKISKKVRLLKLIRR
jgi:hypothetical protein